MWAIVSMLVVLSSGQASGQASASKNYSLSFEKTTQKLKVGAPGSFWMLIQPAAGFKVSREAPLSVALDSQGLKLDKTKLGQKDAQSPKSDAPEFTVKFSAPEDGEKKIQVNASFFVCDEKMCERKNETVELTVAVTD